MMEDNKTDLVIKLIEGGITAEEKREAEILLLQNESLRNFYEDQLWLHRQMMALPMEKAPQRLKNSLLQNHLGLISFYSKRIGEFKIGLWLNIALMFSLFVLFLVFREDMQSVRMLNLYEWLPMEYIVNVGMICIAASSLLYLDKLISMRRNSAQ